MVSLGLPWMIAPATRLGVIDSRRLALGPWNLGTSGGLGALGWVELVTVGSAGSPGSLAMFGLLHCAAEVLSAAL